MTMTMSTTASLMPIVTAAPAAPAAGTLDQGLRLTVPKPTALRHLKQRLEAGVALRRQRIRYAEDLEEVRARKADWVSAYSDLLRQLFHGDAGDALVDSCNDWVGRVYPEYAEMELFVEQFYDEMDYRISRLRAVARQVAGMPEFVPPVTRTSGLEASDGQGTKSALIGASVESATVAKGKPASAAPVAAGAAPALGASGSSSSAPTPSTVSSTTAPSMTPVEESAGASDVSEPEYAPPSSGLFVVHGGSPPASESVRRFLRDVGIQLLALPATPPANKSLVSTLEQGPAASFAVVLLNPEDSAALAAPGACRPAITFQLGYFVGRLGLPRVCVLCEGGADAFHDEHGILCLPLDPANGWHLQLARHLKRAGIEVDLNKLC
jgi:hypothetical protein